MRFWATEYVKLAKSTVRPTGFGQTRVDQAKDGLRGWGSRSRGDLIRGSVYHNMRNPWLVGGGAVLGALASDSPVTGALGGAALGAGAGAAYGAARGVYRTSAAGQRARQATAPVPVKPSGFADIPDFKELDIDESSSTT